MDSSSISKGMDSSLMLSLKSPGLFNLLVPVLASSAILVVRVVATCTSNEASVSFNSSFADAAGSGWRRRSGSSSLFIGLEAKLYAVHLTISEQMSSLGAMTR